MPKPFKRSGTAYFGPTYVLDRPSLAVRMMVIIGQAAYIDAAFVHCLTAMTGVEAKYSTFIFTAIRNEMARGAALRALAREVLDPADLKEFKNIVDTYINEEHSGARNIIAHGIWGISPQAPDVLLYTDPTEYLRWHSELHAAERKGDEEEVRRLQQTFPDALEYDENDFIAVQSRFHELRKRLLALLDRIRKQT